MSNRTLTLIIALIVIAGGLLALALSPQLPKRANITIPVVQTQTADTTLSLIPNPLLFPQSTSSAQLEVAIDTGSNKVTAVQIELAFDPKAITVTDATSSSFLQNPVVLLKNIDNTNGRVSLVLGIPPDGAAQKGNGIIATLTFSNNYSGVKQTGVLFLPKSMATAERATASVLKTTTGTTILLVAPTPSPQASGSAR